MDRSRNDGWWMAVVRWKVDSRSPEKQKSENDIRKMEIKDDLLGQIR